LLYSAVSICIRRDFRPGQQKHKETWGNTNNL
jgi:hypothetical protein